MDRSVGVRTPENTAFTYELAGLGSRFLAVAIDQSIQALVLGALLAGIVLVASHVPAVERAVATNAEKLDAAFGIAALAVIAFTISFAYFIFFEIFWNGQTPGKKALGIRVVRDGGYPVDFGAALIRNLIRVGEFTFGFYLLSAISALASSESKRLGDYAAGTIVVRDARLDLPAPLRPDARQPLYAATAYLSGDERALIKRFLERRDTLDSHRRREMAARLAARVRPRLPAGLQRLDDESLLERL
jgi:uncharacterized RDD family membrane protein YckC